MTRLNIGTTQRAAIKQFLLSGNSITALEALSLFGAYRLAAHVEVLRNRDGMGIVTTMSKDVTGRTYARYSLPVEAQGTGPMVPLLAWIGMKQQAEMNYANH